MTMKSKLLPPPLRPTVVFITAGLLFLTLNCLGLFSQEISGISSPSCLASTSSSDLSLTAEDTRSLLPLIPFKPHTPKISLSPGVAAGLIGPLPGEKPPDPDDDKVLYGYRGPYYNTVALDGRVVVLDRSVFVWPSPTWKATGMLRNQTRCRVNIGSVSARLMGSRGEVLATATANSPVNSLRPGEPGPFSIDAPIPAKEVKFVDWDVEASPASAHSRNFEFEIIDDSLSIDDTHYNLSGVIHNASSTLSRDVRVVMAWLDEENRVFFVKSARLYSFSDPTEGLASLDLKGYEATNFSYALTDPELAPRVADAPGFALWGTSK
jgi:hypothetical protein